MLIRAPPDRRQALAAAPNLKVVARAGIGLDNVDVAAATERGVMVVNAPQSNIISAAEHAMALLLAVARQSPPPTPRCARGGKRPKFTGVEVTDKTVGVVGLGRIGVLFAQRMAAFDASSSPTTPTSSRPGPRSSASAWSRSRSCSARPTSSPSTCRRPPRRSA